MLYREPKLLKACRGARAPPQAQVSVLYREPKLLKGDTLAAPRALGRVSVLYREPKLLKGGPHRSETAITYSFSALP